jgi:hypothetical protein
MQAFAVSADSLPSHMPAQPLGRVGSSRHDPTRPPHRFYVLLHSVDHYARINVDVERRIILDYLHGSSVGGRACKVVVESRKWQAPCAEITDTCHRHDGRSTIGTVVNVQPWFNFALNISVLLNVLRASVEQVFTLSGLRDYSR